MSGRPQHRRLPKPKQNAKKKAKEPETFDDFMSEGVDLEEKGERYGSGDRAQRYYENAADMYSKAHALNPQDADCLYNWGRVLFLLVGFMPEHATPEDKLKMLDQSIEKFRAALNLEHGKSDAQFNLAQALHQKSEILQEATELDNAYQQSAIALQEAISLFETVYKLQEKEYKDQRSLSEQSMDTEGKEEEEEGQTQATETVENTNGQQNNGGEGGETKDYTTVTEVEATTVYSLIDTLLSLADTMTTMASMLASYKASVDLFSRARSNLSMAEKWLGKGSAEDKEYRSARIQINIKEAQTLSALAERILLAQNRVDHALFQQAVERLDEVVEKYDDRNMEALCDRGDILGSYADGLVKECKGNKLSADSGKNIWQLYAQADRSLKAALQLEPKNLNILNKLGDMSIARARLDLPVAQRNRLQLLKNAEFYFKQAVETNRQVLTSGWIGWAFSTWALQEWADVPDKKQEASRIFRTWLKRGGSGELFGDLAEDSATLDPEFVDWVNDNFLEEDDE